MTGRTSGRETTGGPSADLLDRAALRLAAGRARAGDLMPYLNDALYAVKAVATSQIPTVGIDPRWRMYYNPEFILTLDVAEVVGVWLHEVGHPLRRHHERFAALADPADRAALFNQAGDCAINDDLRGAGVRLPALKAWFPERVAGGASGMTAEQLYRLLLAGPTGRNLTRAQGDLLLLPATLPHDHRLPVRILGHAREAFLTGPATVVVRGHDGSSRDAGPAAVHDARTASFELTDRLPPGEHTVDLHCRERTASASLHVTAPGITLRPDSLRRRRSAREKVVVTGRGTRFTAASVVEVTDADGNSLDVVADVDVIGSTSLTFTVGPVGDGTFGVRVRTGTDVVRAALPVGLPRLDVVPAVLPAGFAVPTRLALVGEDVAFGAATTVEVLDVAAGAVPVPGAVGVTTPAGARALHVELTRTLADGPYLVVVDTSGDGATATLTVGARPPHPAPAPAGYDDCGSGAGGPRRPWEGDAHGRDADGADDGSVDAGRAELIRQLTARNVLEHARGRGSVPAGWQRWATETLTPVVDWRRELASVTRRVGASVAGMRDYSSTRPSRRSAAAPGVFLPAMRQPRPPRAVVVVDTSASVTDAMLGRVHAETEAVVRRCHGSAVQVIACDAAAGQVRRVRRLEDVGLVGGGGTDLRVGVAAAAALRPRADLVIVATDGDTPWPQRPPAENPGATYVVLLLDGPRDGVPPWMRTIVVQRTDSA